MSKISFYLRAPNASGLCPVTVRHSHKGSNFPLAAGESVLPQFFDQAKGIATEKHPDCATINSGIRRVVSLMEQAREACQQNKVEPTREHMAHFYDLLVQMAEVQTESQRLQREVTIPKVMLPDLRKRLEKAKKEVEELEAAIAALDPAATGDLVSYWFDQMIAQRKDLAEGSLVSLAQARDRIAKFNPVWRMQEVNNETLRELERWLLAQNYSANTIALTLEKLKSVCYRFGKKLKLDLIEIREHRRDTKTAKANKNGMVTLSEKQINELLTLELKGEQARSRDQFVFLCITGLRYLDSMLITPEIIRARTNEDGEKVGDEVELFLPTGKTDQHIVIPLSQKVHTLLVRNNFDFIRKKRDTKTGNLVNVKDWKKSSNFNQAVRTICRLIPSLHSPVHLSKQRGGKTEHRVVAKHEAIRSHSGRKSMVNNALKRGINPVAVAALVGHANTNLIMTTYGDPSVGADKITEM